MVLGKVRMTLIMFRTHFPIQTIALSISLVFISGCTVGANSVLPMSTQTPILPSSTSTYKLTPGFTNAPVTQAVNAAKTYPSIIMSLGVSDRNPCASEDKSQIWKVDSPFRELKVLAAQPRSDYYYPTLSPDGKLVAFVESKPKITVDPVTYADVTYGVDSIWIANLDGSNPRRIGNGFPSAYAQALFDCFYISGVPFPPVWSPDSQSMILSYRNWSVENNTVEYQYYLENVKSGASRKLFSLKEFGVPAWANNTEVLIYDKTDVHIIKDIKSDGAQVSTVNFPLADMSDGIPSLIKTQDEALLFAFSVGGTYSAPKPKIVSVWSLGLHTQSWTKTADLSISTWAKPVLGNQFGILCDEEAGVYIFDLSSWQIVNQQEIPVNTNLDCNSLKMGSFGREIAFFITTSTDNHFDLWAVDLSSGNQQLILLSTSQIQLPSGRSITAIDYYWNP